MEPTPLFASSGEAIGIGVVVLGITLLSVVLGELVPKRLALNNPLGVALVLARPVRRLSDLTAPVVRLLGALTDAVLRLFGVQPTPEPAVTEDEVRLLVEQGHQAGVFFKTEKAMVERAMALDRKRVGDLMTQRAQIVWLNAADADEINWPKVIASGHSYFPVYEGEHFAWDRFRFEIADMDRHRLDKILIQPLKRTPPGALDAEPPGTTMGRPPRTGGADDGRAPTAAGRTGIGRAQPIGHRGVASRAEAR